MDYKKEFDEYNKEHKKDSVKNLTLIQLDCSKKVLDYKKEVDEYNKEHKKDTVKNLTLITSQFLDYKKEFFDNKKKSTGLINNLTNSIAAIRLMHLGNKAQITKNLTYILLQNNNITRNFKTSVNKLNTLVKINNNTISNVLSRMLDFIEKYKNDFGKNITKILQIMEENEANIVEKVALSGKKIDIALEGRQLFWGTNCPDSWKDIGGVYPMKVCEYTS